jgi:hypothetical protein
LNLLRESGNRGDDYDLLGSLDSQRDEAALDEIWSLCTPFVRILASRLAQVGRLDGKSVHVKFDLWLRENPQVKQLFENR